jgi:hypothetical protein
MSFQLITVEVQIKDAAMEKNSLTKSRAEELTSYRGGMHGRQGRASLL